jgi:ADP-ribosylglycohydrolase
MNRDRVIATFLGVAIGDALGKPVENFTPEKILERYPNTGGRITTYMSPTGHKWFDGHQPGTWTDDCQLTLAVAKGLMESCGLRGAPMSAQAKAHVEAFKQTTSGWGGTTREAVRNLSNGAHWSQSGISAEGRGKGNGVVMKLAPVAIVVRQQHESLPFTTERLDYINKANQFVADLTAMTHPTRMAIGASFAHFRAMIHCLGDAFEPDIFVDFVSGGALYGNDYSQRFPEESSRIDERLDKITEFAEPEEIRQAFGNGSCYCYDSLPFTYAFFLRNPASIESLYDCVSAGGDADSNGSMLASMLGARFGMKIFPEHLIKGLDQVDQIMEFANKFCDQFGID